MTKAMEARYIVVAMSPEIISVVDARHLGEARQIFREYGVSIEHVAACSLQYQRFEDELAGLPGKYAPPRGALFLAYEPEIASESIGCVALRPLPDLGSHVCELKRKYVRPVARNRGIGRLLAERVISEAAAIGYTLMKLDTSGTMVEAQRLYRSLGFVPCAAYNDDPDQDTLWFERVIRPNDAGT
jgi:putative acetyltransferase